MILKKTLQKITFTIIISLLTSALLLAQDNKGNLISQVKPGRNDITFPIKDNENETILPVSIIKGTEPGPVFTIVAGIHGFEYPPIVALQEFITEIDADQLKGTVVVVPIANVASFYARTPFISPIDGKNLNNVFPGKKDGSVTEQIADIITNTIIEQTDVFLDIHAGDASEDLLSFICYYEKEDSPQQTNLAKKLCLISGFENIVSYPYNISAQQPALYAFKQAVQDGKTALSIESGKLGNVQKEAVAETKAAIYRMLEDMKMYPATVRGESELEKSHNFYNRQSYVKSTRQGIFHSDHSAGDVVSKGDIIGFITDIFDNPLQEITAPATGTILYKIGTPPVNINETLVCIGYTE